MAEMGETGVKVWRDRCRSPEDTWSRIEEHLPTCGITRIADVTGLDRIGLPVFMVIRPNSKSVAVSAGKGLTAEGARVSGAMEGIESWHGENTVLPVRFGTCADLAGIGAYQEFGLLTHIAGRARIVAQAATRTLPWVEGYRLEDGSPVWLPLETVSVDLTVPGLKGFGVFLQSTNGLASGNSRDEALVHGLCEVIERDGMGHLMRLPASERAARAIDLDSIEDPETVDLIGMLQNAEFDVTLWDATFGVRVPVVYALITDRRDPEGHFGTGAGCHPNRNTAAIRALTEAAQVRLTYVSGARDDITRFEYTAASFRERLDRVHAEQARAAAAELRNFAELPTGRANTVDQDLATLQTALASGGLDDLFAVDLTRPDIDIPVAKIVVPGLLGPENYPGELGGVRAGAEGLAA